MREQSVPCRGSTLRESIAGVHRTFNDSAMCDRCEVLNAQSVARVRQQLAAREAAPAAASRDDGRAVAETSTVLPPSHPGVGDSGDRAFAGSPVPATSQGGSL